MINVDLRGSHLESLQYEELHGRAFNPDARSMHLQPKSSTFSLRSRYV